MSIIGQYDRRHLNAIRPQFVTFAELKREFQFRYPGLFTTTWFEKELHDLWVLGAPDPNPANEGKRLLLPAQVQKFCKETAQRLGQEIMTHAR